MAEQLPSTVRDNQVAVLPHAEVTKEVHNWTPNEIAIELGRVSERFARVYRGPRYADNKPESDVEHSFMLGMIAPELAHLYFPDLNPYLVGEYSRIHDLVEVKTGDVITFKLTEEELAAKEAAEQNALEELLEELPPYTASLLREYEKQEAPEARFVRAVDKLMPFVVDIIGQGSRLVHEEYGVTSAKELRDQHVKNHERFVRRFGDFVLLVLSHRDLQSHFETKFSVELPVLVEESRQQRIQNLIQ